MKKNAFLVFLLFPVLIFSQVTLTQNTSNTVQPSSSVSCYHPSGAYTNSNSFARLFDLPTLGYSSFQVTRVSFGVQNFVLGPATSFPVTVAIYSSTSGSTPSGLALLGQQDVILTSSDQLQIVNVDLTVQVTANSIGMLITVSSVLSTGSVFVIGANASGQTAPCYLFAATCGFNSYANLTNTGFPYSHYIINVTGNPILGTETFILEKNTVVYPNPVKYSFAVHTVATVEKVEVYSVQGQLIKSFALQAQYEVNDLAKGMYLLRIKTNEGILNKSLIIE